MSIRSDSGRILAVREWLATALGSSLLVYEAVIEHSGHVVVYGVSLVLFGFVPFSILDRALGRWGGDRDAAPPPASRRTDDDAR